MNGINGDGYPVCVQVALNKPINVGSSPKSHRESNAMRVFGYYCTDGAAIGSSKSDCIILETMEENSFIHAFFFHSEVFQIEVLVCLKRLRS